MSLRLLATELETVQVDSVQTADMRRVAVVKLLIPDIGRDIHRRCELGITRQILPNRH